MEGRTRQGHPALGRLLLMSAVAGLVLALSAVAYACMPQSNVDTASDSGLPGDIIEVFGGGFTPGAPIDVYFDDESDVLWSGNADSDGEFSFSAHVPDVEPGRYLIVADQRTWDGDPPRTAFQVEGDAPETGDGGQADSDGSRRTTSGDTDGSSRGAESTTRTTSGGDGTSSAEGPTTRSTSGGDGTEGDAPAPDSSPGAEPSQPTGGSEPAGERTPSPRQPADTRVSVGPDEPQPSPAPTEPAPQTARGSADAGGGSAATPATPATPQPGEADDGPEASPGSADQGQPDRASAPESSRADEPALAEPGQSSDQSSRPSAPGAAPSERAAVGDLWSGLREGSDSVPGLGDGPAAAGDEGDGMLVAAGAAAVGLGALLLAGGSLAAVRRRRVPAVGTTDRSAAGR